MSDAPAQAPRWGDDVRKVVAIVRAETRHLHPWLQLARLLAAPLPLYVGSRARAQLLRMVGFRLGRGTMFYGMPVLTGAGPIHQRLRVGVASRISWGCYLDLEGSVTIGSRVVLAPGVRIVTSEHHIGDLWARTGQLRPTSVVIEDGVWLGTGCMVLPGVTVRRGAVVAAGAVVTKDVPSDVVVGGVPARVLHQLDGAEAGAADSPGAAATVNGS